MGPGAPGVPVLGRAARLPGFVGRQRGTADTTPKATLWSSRLAALAYDVGISHARCVSTVRV